MRIDIRLLLLMIFMSIMGNAIGQREFKELAKYETDRAQSVATEGDYVVVGLHAENNFVGEVEVFKKNSNNSWTKIKTITAFDASSDDAFGHCVDISGNYIIASTYDDDNNAGSVYIYSKNLGGADNWGFVKKIIASDRANNDEFGISCAISGDYIIVGAQNESSDDNQANVLTSAGSAYIYKKNQGGADNWGQIKKIVASDRDTYEYFGSSVSISGDYAIVGSETANSGTGQVYIFQKDEGGSDNWGEHKN